MKHTPIDCPDWLLVAAICTLLLTMVVWDEADAELMLELSAGYSYPTDSLGNDEVGDQPLATAEAGWNSKSGYGISYLHISNPTARDYGINMLRVKKRFTW